MARKSWMWLFQRSVMELAMKRSRGGHMRLTSAVTTGATEIDIAGEVGPNDQNYHEPRLHLRLVANGDLQVTSSCTCFGKRALCEHAATLMFILGRAEAQQLVEIISAKGESRAAEEPPKPEDITVIVPNDEPRPVLVLRRITIERPHLKMARTAIAQVKRSIGIAEPQVRYDDCPDTFQMLGRGTGSRWTAEDGSTRVLTRHLRMERLYVADLMQAGLAFVRDLLPDVQSAETLQPLMSVAESTQSIFWARFLEEQVPALRAEGWDVQVSPDFGFTIHQAGDEAWFTDLQSESAGRDSFSLDLGIEIEGQRVSLVPILVDCIEQGLTPAMLEQNLEQRFLLALPPPSHDVLSVPARRLLVLLRFLDELLATRPARKDGKLQLDKLRAAQLATLDGLPIRAPAELGILRERLVGFKEMSLVEPPVGLKASLRPYQREGLSWLQFLREFSLHGVLADDMGLGKTVQTLAHLLTEKEAGRMDRPTLIVAPTSVIRNWAREAAKFTPAMNVLLLHGDERHADFYRIKKHDLVITSFPLLVRDADQLGQIEWHVIALDEAQNIKNPKSKAAQAAGSLKCRHRLCLTGTPMENHLGELWSLFHFLMPGLLGDAETFRTYYRTPIERDADTERQQQLSSRLAPLLLRRTKSAVAKDLPPKTEILHSIELDKAQTDLYETIRAAMDARVREAISNQGIERSQIIVLDALLKLRQVCCHPQLLKIEAAKKLEVSAKTAYLMEDLLPELLDEGHRVLIFSQFTEMLAIIEAELKKAGIDFVQITGQTKDRETPQLRFQKGEVPVFLISLKAGGSGLNLTAADTVIHYDPWWNPAAEAQASDRAHRIGQTKPVFIHKLICQSTIEERIVELQKTKAALIEGLLTGRAEKLTLTNEDIQRLLEA
jgi:superfamily II DNA or RNA helicase